MVMKPEPWGEALDELLPDGADARGADARPGRRSPRRSRASWPAGSGWSSPAAATKASTSGCSTTPRAGPRCARSRSATTCSTGERSAALAITEAVVRLLPGFMGNAESLVEESHEDGLLEYPVYTKPASLARPATCPPVLLSGDHAAIAAWRHDQAVRRTAERRPDLLPAARRCRARWRCGPRDAGRRRRALTLQLACWVQEHARQPGRRDPGAARDARRPAGAGCPSGHRAGRSRRAGRLVGAVAGRAATATPGTSAG